MNLEIENQTLFFIIIGVFIVQFLVIRYYVLNTIEQENRINNKKMIKKVSNQINSTFDEYMGHSNTINTSTHVENIQQPVNQDINIGDIDSIDDPVNDLNE